MRQLLQSLRSLRVASATAALLATTVASPLVMAQVPPSGIDPSVIDSWDEDGGERDALVIACFAEGTTTGYVDEVNARVDAFNAMVDVDRYQLNSRWAGTQGDPINLTWSFAPDGLSIPSGVGEGTGPNTLFATFDAQFGGNRALWISKFQAVFDRWQALSGLNYSRISVGGNDWDDGAAWNQSGSAGLRGDLRICAKAIDGGSGVLAYNFFPGSGTGGNMHLDSGDSWNSASQDYRFLRNTIAHEHGHGLGLNHVCPITNSKLMEPFLSTSFNGPQHDDIRGAQRHYGDIREIDNTTPNAGDLGTLTSAVTVTPCTIPTPVIANSSVCSIDANGETDFFKFTVNTSGTVNVTLTPVGLTYTQGPQTSQCDTGTSVNSLTQADLVLAVIGTNGTTVLGTANNTAAGSAESLTNIALSGAGTYFIRITENDSPTQTQMYTLSVTYTSGGCVAPSLSAQPSNQTSCLAGSASYSVTAGGTGPLSYQWRRGTTNLVNGGNISGATSATLTINPIGAGDYVTNYNCVVTNACGSVTSNNASLTQIAGVSINTQPSPQTVCEFDGATFTVSATGGGTLTYQWMKNGVDIGGATNPSYTIVSATTGDAGNYSVEVTGTCGSVTSNSVALTVNVPPSIDTDPAPQTVDVGDPVSFTVAASGSPTLTYQWQKNNVNIGGATSSTYSIVSAQASDAGTYRCVVTNGCDSVNSGGALLTVNTPPACPGDTNGDNVVDLTDLSVVLANFGLPSGATLETGDLDGDGDVDLSDLSIVIGAFGTPCP